jgi:pyruvate decarboxylase
MSDTACRDRKNNGYTIERAIHGRNQGYNDIASWPHLQALFFFGDDGVRPVEVFMGQDDCQGILLDLLKKQIALEE